MSILDTIRQNTNSLDDYAKLPQAMLMNMAQKGQLPKDMLAPILARKAEMADAAAAMRAAAESRNAPQGSIIEQLMARNAQMERPVAPRDVGVAALPVREDMYNEQSFASGGIVAFSGEEGSYVDADLEARIVNDPGLSFDQKLELLREKGYAPRATDRNKQRSLFDRGADALKRSLDLFKPLPERLQRFGTPAQVRAAGVYGGDVDTQPGYTPSRPIAQTSVAQQDAANRAAAAKTTATTKKVAEDIVEKAPEKKLFEDYEKMLMAQGEESKKAREEARNMRLLEAGLGILGGTSPYALTNIGAGAIGAAKGYGQDIAGLRKEERERAKELAGIGAKREEFAIDREKIAMLEKRYKEMADIDRLKISQLAAQNKDEKTARLVGQAFNTLMSEYKTRLDRGDVTPADLYVEAQRMVASTTGGNIGASTSKVPNKGIGFSDFMSKK